MEGIRTNAGFSRGRRATGRCRVRGGGCLAQTRGNDVSKLLDLMRKLGSDAALEAEYRKDPEGVVRRAGLTDEERRALLELDFAAIKDLTGLEDGQFATNHVVKAYDH